MHIVKKTLIGLLLITIAVQFYRPVQNKDTSVMPDHISKVVTVPEQVNGILKKACYDCHSNNTRYPWYAQIQPINWYVNRHIDTAKKALNFDNFKGYTTRRQMSKLRAVYNSLEDGTMPIAAYTMIHKNAVLSKAEKEAVMAWTAASGDSLEKVQF